MQTFSFTVSGHSHDQSGAAIGFVLAFDASPYVGALQVLTSRLPDRGWAFVGEGVTLRGPFAEQRLLYEDRFGHRRLERMDDGTILAEESTVIIASLVHSGVAPYAISPDGRWFRLLP